MGPIKLLLVAMEGGGGEKTKYKVAYWPVLPSRGDLLLLGADVQVFVENSICHNFTRGHIEYRFLLGAEELDRLTHKDGWSDEDPTIKRG